MHKQDPTMEPSQEIGQITLCFRDRPSHPKPTQKLEEHGLVNCRETDVVTSQHQSSHIVSTTQLSVPVTFQVNPGDCLKDISVFHGENSMVLEFIL